MTFQCVSFLGFGTFILTEEGESKLSWTHDAHRHPNGYMQALFPMGPMFPSRKWKFRCYGYDKSNPHVWSVPSNPEELKFSGENVFIETAILKCLLLCFVCSNDMILTDV